MARTDRKQHNDSKDPPKRRRHAAPVLGVEAFAHRKGVTKGLHSFRERQEKKRVQTATALRAYKKVMKQEGYQPGQGASRKRREELPADKTNDTTHNSQQEQKHEQHHHNNNNNNNNRKERKQRTHLFQKAVHQSQERQQKVEQSQQDRVVNEKERIKKLKQRSFRTKLHCQRTKKGQPVMNNLVQDVSNRSVTRATVDFLSLFWIFVVHCTK